MLTELVNVLTHTAEVIHTPKQRDNIEKLKHMHLAQDQREMEIRNKKGEDNSSGVPSEKNVNNGLENNTRFVNRKKGPQSGKRKRPSRLSRKLGDKSTVSNLYTERATSSRLESQKNLIGESEASLSAAAIVTTESSLFIREIIFLVSPWML